MKCAGVRNVVVTRRRSIVGERGARVPRRQDRDRASREQRRERVAARAGVVRGSGEQVHVVLAEAPHRDEPLLRHRHRVGREPAVHDALGPAGRARCVEDERGRQPALVVDGVGVGDRGLVVRRRRSSGSGNRGAWSSAASTYSRSDCVGDEHLRAGVREDPCQLVGLEMPVDREEARLGAARRGRCLEELEAVRHHGGDRARAVGRDSQASARRRPGGRPGRPGRRRCGRHRRGPAPACPARRSRAAAIPSAGPSTARHTDTRVRYDPARCASTGTRWRCRTRRSGSGRCSRTTTAGPRTRRWCSRSRSCTRATTSGNGLLRRVIYKMPLGRRGSALELVTDVEANHGYTYTMLSREPGQDQTGKVRLEPHRAQPHQVLVRGALQPHEGRRGSGSRDRSTNSSTRRTRQSMQRASEWLTEHPEYRPDLVETDERARRQHDASPRRCQRRCCDGKDELVVEEVPVPDVGPTDVLVEVSHCGVCGSDLHMVLDGWGRRGSIGGHEWSGVVVAIGRRPSRDGRSATRSSADRRRGAASASCAAPGHPSLCVERDTPGTGGEFQGAFARYIEGRRARAAARARRPDAARGRARRAARGRAARHHQLGRRSRASARS